MSTLIDTHEKATQVVTEIQDKIISCFKGFKSDYAELFFEKKDDGDLLLLLVNLETKELINKSFLDFSYCVQFYNELMSVEGSEFFKETKLFIERIIFEEILGKTVCVWGE